LYILYTGSATISQYSLNSSTGALGAAFGSYSLPLSPLAVTIDPSGAFAYVPNAGASTVSAFRIDPSSGNLTPVPGSPFPAGTGPVSVAVSK
jgi:6-phosphogluconolactonase